MQNNAEENVLTPVKRIVLKISGESFCPANERGISMDSVNKLAAQIANVAKTGVQVAVVMGGGNILRGAQFKASDGASSIQEATAHYMGMLATVINGSALHDALEAQGQPTRLMTAIKMDVVAEPYIRRRALRHLEKGRVVILSGGMGTPFVTTDTAAAQRALELQADFLFKATKVDGVYSADPNKDPNAVFYPNLTFDEAISQNLRVMDQEAFAKCHDHGMPIMIFNFRVEGNLERAVRGEHVGTIIR
ncbi:MAG: UMP kinase [Thermoguttaceae bacterium]|nr:UMP kinase [Thermoguttaceae bacterium]MBR4751430.1 UMP kinase [Thermoguttaceae bacterium]MBR5757142.1 UMP kinase [Thermoguttaceae bacterium]